MDGTVCEQAKVDLAPHAHDIDYSQLCVLRVQLNNFSRYCQAHWSLRGTLGISWRFVSSRDQFKSEFQVVLQTQRAAGERDRLDAIVRLPDGEIAGNA